MNVICVGMGVPRHLLCAQWNIVILFKMSTTNMLAKINIHYSSGFPLYYTIHILHFLTSNTLYIT